MTNGFGSELEVVVEATELERLRREALSLREMLEAVPAFVLRTDRSLVVVDHGRRLPPFDRAIVGAELLSIVPPSIRSEVERLTAALLETGETQREVVAVNGRWWASEITALADGDLLHVVTDATEIQSKTRLLLQSEDMLRLAREVSGLGLWALEPLTGKLVWDEAMYRITGVDRPIGMDAWLAHVPADEVHAVRGDMEETMRTGVSRGMAHRFLRPDGSTRWLATTARVVPDADGTPRVVGCTQDVTDAHRTEERLREAMRLETIGQLAAGIAHNFNNLLAVVVPSLELVRQGAAPATLEILDDAAGASMRAADVVRQLMTFARGRSADIVTSVRAAELVRRAVGLCRRLFIDVPVTVMDAAGDVWLRVPGGEVEQALINLLMNARDAVLASGRDDPSIAVALRIVGGSELPVEVVLPEPHAAQYAVIAVEDNGDGVSDAVRARLFEPFFTTKELGRGTGLGLATARATASRAGGALVCRATPAAGGACFELFLPLSEAGPEAMAEVDVALGKGQKVLVVDDDESVRRTVVRMLNRLGYTPLTAGSAAEALAVALEEPEVAVVLLDRTMPGGSGPRVIETLRTLMKGVRVVYFTGDDVAPAEAEWVDAVLNKPVTATGLGQALQAALGPSA